MNLACCLKESISLILYQLNDICLQTFNITYVTKKYKPPMQITFF